MNSAPYFSVVIPAYNRAQFIGKSIESVLNQRFTDFEVIIVNDGSSDNTGDVVKGFRDPCIRYFEIANHERGAARNFGVKQSAGRFVTFLDSDDFLKPEHLGMAYEFLQKNPGAKVFSLGYDIIAPDGHVIYPWKALPNPCNKKLMEGNFLSCLGVFVEQTEILENSFNEDRALAGSEDYELWIRLAARHPIYTLAVSTACLLNHEERSVVQLKPEKLLLRRALLKQYIWADTAVQNEFSSFRNKLEGYMDLYVSLHLSMGGFKGLGFGKLLHAFGQYPPMFMSKRFWAVIKKLLLS
jgi:glycosyltransferase involved in cell wall biosynthesis